MIAVTPVRNDTPGRVYYLRKQAEGHSRTEAMRALKRRISDVVYRQLLAGRPRLTSRPGRANGNGSNGQRDRLYTLTAGSSVKPLPDDHQRYARPPNSPSTRSRNSP